MKWQMVKTSAFLLVAALLVPASLALAENVGLNPGYIVGRVQIGDFTTTSISINASTGKDLKDGGYIASKSVTNSSSYQITVPGGEGDYYSIWGSCGLSGGNNRYITMKFSPRNLPGVAVGQTVTNDYVLNPGIIRFQVNISGAPVISSFGTGNAQKYGAYGAPSGELTDTNATSNISTSSSYSWDMPVVPNQQVALAANVWVYTPGGQRNYSFNSTSASPYNIPLQDVAPGQLVVVPLNIQFIALPPFVPLPPGPPPVNTGFAGTINLMGLPIENFARHGLSYPGIITSPSNPGAYTWTTQIGQNTIYNGNAPQMTTYFDSSMDNAYLRWPSYKSCGDCTYPLYPNQYTTLNFENEGAFLAGNINFTGAVKNEDLQSYTLTLGGVYRIWLYPNDWSKYETTPTTGAITYIRRNKATQPNVKSPTERSYKAFLSVGGWEGSWTLTKQTTSPYYKNSTSSFGDSRLRWTKKDGTFNPNPGKIYVAPGVTNRQDFEYCLGSAIYRFRVVGGGVLSSPSINYYYSGFSNPDGISVNVGANSSAYNVDTPDLEIFGPDGNYKLTPFVTTQDGTRIEYPDMKVSLACDTTKIIDLPGPTLTVADPGKGLITNALSLPVAGKAYSTVSIAGITVNNQSAALSPTGGDTPNEVAFSYPLPLADGKNTITVTARDADNAQTTDQLIVFADRWLPTVSITTPNNGNHFLDSETNVPLTVQAADQGYGYTLEVYLDGTIIYNGDGTANDTAPVPISYAGSLGSLSAGDHVISAVATDRAGNKTTTSVTIVVSGTKDTTPPVLQGLVDQILEATSTSGATASFSVKAKDVVDPAPVVTCSVASGATFPPGETTVTCTAKDASGNSASGTFTIIVKDTTPPVLTVPADKTAEAIGPQTPVAIGQATATDIYSVTVTNNAPATYGIGTTMVTWTAKDANNNSASKEQKITVQDTTPPLVTPPANLAVEATGALTQVNIGTATATDAVGVVSLTSSALAAGYPLGATTIIWIAKDAAGNAGTSVPQIITVKDTTPPILHGLANQIIEATSTSGATASFTVTATDTLDAAPVVTCSAASGATFALGETTATCTAKDASNNTITGTFKVTVVDATPPALTVPPDKIVEATGPLTPVAIGQATTTDIFPVTVTNDALAAYGIGTTTVTWTANDANNNSTSKEQKITVQDTTPPLVMPPANLTVEATGTLTQVNIGTATATDAVGVVSLTSSAPAAGYPLGTTTVNWTAKDSAGNAGTSAPQVITVKDTIPPVLHGLANQTIEATSTFGAIASFTVTATDTIDVAPVVTCSAASGATFALGETTVTCTANDTSNNSAAGTFIITVVDATPPILAVPPDKIVEATGPQTTVAIGQATATDLFPVTVANNALATYGIGTTTVIWTAKDANNNSATKEQKITVQDTTPPVVTPPTNITVEATGPLTQVNIGTAAATDAVGVASLNSSAPAAGYPLGATTVIWTARDAAGNTGTATQTVIVKDTTPPALQGLVNQVLEATSTSGATASFSVTAKDLVDPAPAVACSAASGSTFPLGQTTVTCTARDARGNSTTGSFTVTVRDTAPPVLTLPADITVLLNTPLSDPAVQGFLGGATAVDIVDPTVAITFTAPQSHDSVGAKQVTFTAVDDFGNKTTGSATIYVVYGCGNEFLPPVNLLKPFKLGSTIPVKLALCDASGSTVTSAVAKLYLQQYSGGEPVGSQIEVISTSGAGTGNYFRVSEGMYIYNLYTKSLSSGTYQIRAVLDDGTARTVPLELKQ